MGLNQKNTELENTEKFTKLSYIDNKSNFDEFLNQLMEFYANDLKWPQHMTWRLMTIYKETLKVKRFYSSIWYQDNSIDNDQDMILNKIKWLEGFEDMTKEKFENLRGLKDIWDLSTDQQLLLTMNMKK